MQTIHANHLIYFYFLSILYTYISIIKRVTVCTLYAIQIRILCARIHTTLIGLLHELLCYSTKTPISGLHEMCDRLLILSTFLEHTKVHSSFVFMSIILL